MPTLDEYFLLLLMMMEVNHLCQILIGSRYVQTKSRYMQVPKDCFKNQACRDWLFKKTILSTIQGGKNPIQSIGVISKFTQSRLYSIILQIRVDYYYYLQENHTDMFDIKAFKTNYLAANLVLLESS